MFFLFSNYYTGYSFASSIFIRLLLFMFTITKLLLASIRFNFLTFIFLVLIFIDQYQATKPVDF